MPPVDSIRRESHAAAQDVFQPVLTQKLDEYINTLFGCLKYLRSITSVVDHELWLLNVFKNALAVDN